MTKTISRSRSTVLLFILCVGLIVSLHVAIFAATPFQRNKAFLFVNDGSGHDASSESEQRHQALLERVEQLENTVLQELQHAHQRTQLQQPPPVANTNEILSEPAKAREEKQRQPQTPQVLPTCREIMLRPQSPYRDGSFLMREATSTTWIPRTDGSRELTLNVCQLHRYTAAQARECLTGEHFLNIGDSLTRYMTLSLAHFIHRGEWPPRFTREKLGAGGNSSQCIHLDEYGQEACSKPNEPHLLSEGTFRYNDIGRNGDSKLYDAWERLQALVGGWTDGGIFDGHMECSCARSNKRQQCITSGCTADNLLYVSEPMDNNNNTNSNTEGVSSNGAQEFPNRIILSYISQIGWGDSPSTIKGFNLTGCAFTGTCRRDEKTTKRTLDRINKDDYDWEATLEDALQPDGIIQKQWPSVPTLAMYNRGLWGQLTKSQAKKLFPLLYNFTRSSSKADEARCFFRGTTGSKRTLGLVGKEREITRPETFEAGCTFLDLAHVTNEFSVIHPKVTEEYQNVFWDAVHYQPWVYEEVNNLLLNVLCNAKVLQSAP